MRKYVVTIILVCFSLPCVATTCAIESDGFPDDMKNISMVSVIANNKTFDNKIVSLIGILNVHSNNRFQIYKDQESITYMILSESIFLGFDKIQHEKYGSQLGGLLGEYVNVVGVFHSDSEKDAGYLSNIIFVCKAMTRKQMDKNAEEAARKWEPKKRNK